MEYEEILKEELPNTVDGLLKYRKKVKKAYKEAKQKVEEMELVRTITGHLGLPIIYNIVRPIVRYPKFDIHRLVYEDALLSKKILKKELKKIDQALERMGVTASNL